MKYTVSRRLRSRGFYTQTIEADSPEKAAEMAGADPYLNMTDPEFDWERDDVEYLEGTDDVSLAESVSSKDPRIEAVINKLVK